jgi:hypothetical protein
MLVVVEDERPGVDDCALVVAVVVPIAVADVDVAVVVAAAVVDAFVVAVVGELAAVQLAAGRLEQTHREGVVVQSCGFR